MQLQSMGLSSADALKATQVQATAPSARRSGDTVTRLAPQVAETQVNAAGDMFRFAGDHAEKVNSLVKAVVEGKITDEEAGELATAIVAGNLNKEQAAKLVEKPDTVEGAALVAKIAGGSLNEAEAKTLVGDVAKKAADLAAGMQNINDLEATGQKHMAATEQKLVAAVPAVGRVKQFLQGEVARLGDIVNHLTGK
ncbi:MAG: hypothetical protein SFZ03_09705 [Candidatus Melainabacteria bacterium]|nr:hypothetical protein [Candidatus Melainabacteria bacterium]